MAATPATPAPSTPTNAGGTMPAPEVPNTGVNTPPAPGAAPSKVPGAPPEVKTAVMPPAMVRVAVVGNQPVRHAGGVAHPGSDPFEVTAGEYTATGVKHLRKV